MQKNLSLILALIALGLGLYAAFKPRIEYHSPTPGDYIRDVLVPQHVKTFGLPDSLSFAGEPVPLGDPDVRERLDREIHVNTFFHSSTIFLIKRSARWLPQIKPILKEEGLPEDMVYLTLIESGLQNVVSPSQAVGFWQILKGTGKELGLEINREVDERYNPIKSTRAATVYLKEAYEKFGNWTNAAASYNIGKKGLNDELVEQKVDSYYDLDTNEETGRYIFRALALKIILSDPSKFGYEIDDSHLYLPEETRPVQVTETITDLAEWANQQGINYKLLVRHNPWLRRNKLTVRSGNSYTINLPVNG
ncbi:MAG: lytic transglycosylase domain-containing protein [Bacteroidota bacterium]